MVPTQARETAKLSTQVRTALTVPWFSLHWAVLRVFQHFCVKIQIKSVHALVGIYYTPGSLKAKLCIDGRQRLYEYCDSHHVPYNKLGKLLVAVHDDQIPKLKGFLENGKKNGMTDLEWVNGPAVKELEPELNCVAALW